MIKVNGIVTLKCYYEVELDMSEADFDNLTTSEQNEEIENAINWHNIVENGETDDIDIYELKEEVK